LALMQINYTQVKKSSLLIFRWMNSHQFRQYVPRPQHSGCRTARTTGGGHGAQ
jgi:hypothetical protein